MDKSRKLHDLWIEAVNRLGRDVPLFLSGGVDSTSILFAQLELGIKPLCISFRCDGRDHEDTRAARRLSEAFGFKLEFADMKLDAESCFKDAKKIILAIRKSEKTAVHNAVPVYYMARFLREKHDRNQAYISSFIDIVMGLNKQVMIIRGREGEEGYRKARAARYDRDLGNHGIAGMWLGAKMAGVEILDPARGNAAIRELMLSATFREMHGGFEKKILVNAFRDFWLKGKFYRKKSNMQINAGIRDAHQRLLIGSSKYNKRKSKDVRAVYNDILAGRL